MFLQPLNFVINATINSTNYKTNRLLWQLLQPWSEKAIKSQFVYFAWKQIKDNDRFVFLIYIHCQHFQQCHTLTCLVGNGSTHWWWIAAWQFIWTCGYQTKISIMKMKHPFTENLRTLSSGLETMKLIGLYSHQSEKNKLTSWKSHNKNRHKIYRLIYMHKHSLVNVQNKLSSTWMSITGVDSQCQL